MNSRLEQTSSTLFCFLKPVEFPYAPACTEDNTFMHIEYAYATKHLLSNSSLQYVHHVRLNGLNALDVLYIPTDSLFRKRPT